MVDLVRRSFLTGLIAFGITAPAIVRAGSLMPVKRIPPADEILALLARRVKAAEDEMVRHLNECLEREFYKSTPRGGLHLLLEDTGIGDIARAPRVTEVAIWPMRRLVTEIALHG